MASSRRGGPRPSTSGVIQRAVTRSRSVRPPPWTPKRGEILPATSASPRRQLKARTRHDANTRDMPYTTDCTGGPAAPLPFTPAGGAAGGEGEGRQRVNAQRRQGGESGRRRERYASPVWLNGNSTISAETGCRFVHENGISLLGLLCIA
jgi:hypothetical protein